MIFCLKYNLKLINFKNYQSYNFFNTKINGFFLFKILIIKFKSYNYISFNIVYGNVNS